MIWGKANTFNASTQMEFINTVRNFYGEQIAFYFLFIYHYTLWLMFPTIIGFAVFICYFNRVQLQEYKTNINLSALDIIYFIYSVLIILWANLLLKVWKQKEKIYSFFWGTENYEVTEPFDDNFESDYVQSFLFHFKIPSQSKIKKIMKFVISYCIVALFVKILNLIF